MGQLFLQRFERKTPAGCSVKTDPCENMGPGILVKDVIKERTHLPAKRSSITPKGNIILKGN